MRALMFVFFVLVSLCAHAEAEPAAGHLRLEARELVDAWLAAQNGGDLAAYERLYARRFTGIRRSGPRTVKLDRAGWLKDRARMFRNKMTVSAAELSIHATTSVAQVGFVQSWSSGSYADVGEKRLVLLREGGQLKIAREELMRSSLARAQGIARPGDTELPSFGWVIEGGVVLAAGDAAWAPGGFSFATHNASDATTVVARVEATRLPPELAAWIGRRLRGYDAEGAVVCEAEVRAFRLVGRVFEHMSSREEWRDKKEHEAAAEAWKISDQQLVGDLGKGCQTAILARPSALPMAKAAAFAPADADMTTRAQAAFRQLPAYQRLQKDWLESEASREAKGAWEGATGPTVRIATTVIAGKPVTLISASADRWEGCSGFSGALWSLWQLESSGLILRNDPGSLAIEPRFAIDLDGDGTAELIHEGVLGSFGRDRGTVRAVKGRYEDSQGLSIPFLDCPC